MSLALDAVTLPPDAIEVGRIGEAWGIQGWFKIQSFSNDPQAFFSSKRWYLCEPLPRAGVSIQFQGFSGVRLLKISQVKEHSAGIVATSLEVPDRNIANSLRGARIFISRASFPTLPEDEFYWVDLIGYQVINRQNIALGNVINLHTTGPHAVLVLEKTMIPFVSTYVDEVDKSNKTVRVDWQSDYLD